MDFRSLEYHRRRLLWGKQTVVTDLIHDQEGLKLFNVVTLPYLGRSAFDPVVRFFENADAMIKVNG